MNETLKTIHKRYTCRAYTGEMPPEADLRAVAEAALAAPSGMNGQPWHVILVKDRALIAEMEAEGLTRVKAMPDQAIWERLRGRGGTMYYHAPCMLMITTRGGPADTAIMIQTAALAAASLGIDNCICGMAGIAFEGERGDEFKQRLGFPEGYGHGLSLLMGYAATPGKAHELDYNKISVVE